MKVLFDHPDPFLLAHGGFQIQIEQTRAALESIGVEVEYLRWWDPAQRPDIIHYFGRPPLSYIDFAHQKGIKVILAQLLSGAASRSHPKLVAERACIAVARRALPGMLTRPFAWDAFRRVDACVALTAWEAHLMSWLFGAPRESVRVVPNGVENVFLESAPLPRGKWLVCTATIADRKRVLELAQAAVLAKVPLWVIGKAYSDSDPYAQAFLQLARKNPEWIRYEGPISDRGRMAQIYREARGFVLLSTKESLSLSALEAAACECPLFLSDLPWARTTFGGGATYCPIASPSKTSRFLREYYEQAPHQNLAARPASWTDVARQLRSLYESLLNTSR